MSVVNSSSHIISNTVVTFSGGQVSFGVLQPNETRTLPLHPRRKSDAKVTFSDAAGNAHERVLDVYFEPGYRGLLRITINPSLEVTCQNSLSR